MRKFLLFLGDLADDLIGIGDSLPRRVSRRKIRDRNTEIALLRIGARRARGEVR